MPSEIYNEGRVVGYSAYESYVRQHVAMAGGSATPASEREWLASSLASGAAVLVKIPEQFGILSRHVHTSNQWTYVDIPFPVDSRLCAANCIIAALFEGEGIYDNPTHPFFATGVKDYGSNISNVDEDGEHPSNPSNNMNDVPTRLANVSIDELNNGIEKRMVSYAKIMDGIIIQPGAWPENPAGEPPYILEPDMSKAPGIRLQIAGIPAAFDTEIEILLIGFTDRAVVYGETGVQPAQSTSGTDANGNFLGPALFPWAGKVVFISPAFSNYFLRWRIDIVANQLSAIYDQIQGTYNVSTGYQDLALSGDTAKNALTKIQVDNDTCYALSLRNETMSTPSNATVTNLADPDGYIYWEHLIKALHCGTNGDELGRVSALPGSLRQLNYYLRYIGDDGSYVITKYNNNYGLYPYLHANQTGDYIVHRNGDGTVELVAPLLFGADKFKNKVNLIRSPSFETEYTGQSYYQCIYRDSSNNATKSGTGPLFSDAKLAVIGYIDEYNNGTSSPNFHYTYTANALATLTLLPSTTASYGISGSADEWAQRFYLSDNTNIQTVFDLICSLRKSSPGLVGTKSIIFSGAGVPLPDPSSSVWKGSCRSHMDVCVYLNIGSILVNLQNRLTNGKTLRDIVKIQCTGTTDGVIEGIMFGRAFESKWLGSVSTPVKVPACEIVGSINTTLQAAGYNNNSGKVSLLITFQDDTTQSIANMNL